MALWLTASRVLEEGLRPVRPSGRPTVLPHGCRSVDVEPDSQRPHASRAIFPEGAVHPRVRRHGAGGRPYPRWQGSRTLAARPPLGGVGPDLHVLRIGDWGHAHLRYPRLDSPLDWKGGPVVPLGCGGVRGDEPTLSRCVTLRPCRNRLGLGRFRLGSHHSRTPVRGATGTPSDHSGDRRRVTISSCLRRGGSYISPVPARSSDLAVVVASGRVHLPA